jgi:tRNA(fMet)-specific endonuclease VapC
VRAVVVSARWLAVPAIVLGELRTGFALGRRQQKNEAELGDFLAHPNVHILNVDEITPRYYAQIVVALRKKGMAIPTNDVWIASLAMREAATIVSFDAHFSAIDTVASLILKLD